MDWLKTILDRLSGLLASIIPGSVLFLLFALHQPSLIGRLWETPLLTYNTKLAISVLFALAIGHTVNFALATLMHGVGGAIGGYIGAGPARPDPDVKPWQNKNWRALLTRYLGQAAPENIDPVYEEVFTIRMQAIGNYPEQERAQRAAALLQEKARAESNDFEWRGWWEHFHRASFLKREPEALLYDNIHSGFCAASLIVLVALPFTTELRKWWVIAVCTIWILILILRTLADMRAVLDPWSSYTRQVEQLEEKIGGTRRVENES